MSFTEPWIDVQLVDPADTWRKRSLIGRSFAFGIVLCAFAWALSVFLLLPWPGRASPFRPIYYILTAVIISLPTLLVPILSLVWVRSHVATFGRRVAAICATSVGVFTIPCLIVLISNGGRMLAHGRLVERLVSWHISYSVLTLSWLLISLLAWPTIKRKWPFVFQDGQSCPQCGYCLRGVTSRVCPECGRAFNEYDLGLSTVDFEHLIAGQLNSASAVEITS